MAYDADAIIIGAGLAALPVVYLLIVRVSYRYERVVAFLNPTADPQGHGFQLLQSLIAVGSGGLNRPTRRRRCYRYCPVATRSMDRPPSTGWSVSFFMSVRT